MQPRWRLPGGEARRPAPRGLAAGTGGSHIQGPADALALVRDALVAAEEALPGVLGDRVAALPAIATYLLAAGGKRLRPALTALGGRTIGFDGDLSRVMCAGELIHLGSLLHDDVVDQGEVRRGQPAAHLVYGNASAVLSGDFCVAKALLVASEHGSPDAATALARTVAEMSEGEVIQLQRAGDLDNDLDTYLDIIDRKSASLIAWCTSVSARIVGDVDAAARLEAYGRRVGRAYQITDDVLDYRERTGKLPGADLRERKVTLPLLFAMQRDRSIHAQLVAGPPTEAELPGLVEKVKATGALDDALDEARRFVDEAAEALEGLPAGEGRDALGVLATYLVERTS